MLKKLRSKKMFIRFRSTDSMPRFYDISAGMSSEVRPRTSTLRTLRTDVKIRNQDNRNRESRYNRMPQLIYEVSFLNLKFG
jgi:hypothetical protein